METLRCSKPGCGNTYSEETQEFEDGFCSCGAALVEVEDTAVKTVDEILNGELATPLFEKEMQKEQASSENKQKEKPVCDQAVGASEIISSDDLEVTLDNFVDTKEDRVYVRDGVCKDIPQVESVLNDVKEMEDDEFPTYLIGENNKIVFRQDESYRAVYEKMEEQGYFGDPYEDYEGDRIQLILDGDVLRTYPLEQDETLIGREHDGIIPEVDYTNIDTERYISRRHALIYRQQNEYFIRNLSTKNSVHVNKEVVLEKEFHCLQDGDKIILSRKYGLVFKKKSESEHI